MIGDDGEQLGIMTTADALKAAMAVNLDLVEVAPTNAPPVCRILDYGRLRYLSAKKERESRKSQKSNALREVRFRPRISSHDLSSKVKKVKELLDEGSKVKVSVFFRGREVTHQQIGMALLKQVADKLKDEAKLEQAPSFEQRHLSITLAPLPQQVERKARIKEEAGDAETEDTQGSTGQVSDNGIGEDHAEEAHDEPQPSEEAEESTQAVRG